LDFSTAPRLPIIRLETRKTSNQGVASHERTVHVASHAASEHPLSWLELMTR
jgi:hypothetical protein